MNLDVITTNRNGAHYLERCILSVESAFKNTSGHRRRTFNGRHIVVDGASTDDSIDVLQKHSAVLWKSEPDKGQSDAFNKGVQIAQGDWILWLNADDELTPNAVVRFLETLERNPTADVIYGHVQFIDEQNRHVKTCYHLPYHYSLIWNNVYIPPSSGTFFRRELLLRNPLDINYHYVMDVEWFIRCGRNLRAVLVDHVLSRFRISSQGKTSKMITAGTVTEKHLRERERYRQKYLYSQWPGLTLEQAQRRLARRRCLARLYYYALKMRYLSRYIADRSRGTP